MRISQFILVLIFFSINTYGKISSKLHSIHEQYEFNSIGIESGLCNSRVLTINQDKNGNIWMGTSAGIAKYDGYSITNYTTYMSNSKTYRIYAIMEIKISPDQKIWASCEDIGVLIYNEAKDVFEKLNCTYKDHKTLTSSSVCFIDDKAFISDYASVWIYNWRTEKTENVLLLDSIFNKTITAYDYINKSYYDSRGNIWFAIQHKGVIKYNIKKETANLFNYDKNNTQGILDDHINTFYEDKNGRLWLGGWNNGMYYYNYNTNEFKQLFPDKSNPHSCRVRAMIEDDYNNFWIGTRAGLYQLETKSMTFIKYADTNHPVSSLSNNSIQCIFIDKHNNLWLGTYAGGVSYTNLKPAGFSKLHTLNPNSSNIKKKININAISIDNNSNIWIGTEQNGMYIKNNNTNITYPATSIIQKNSTVKSIISTSRGDAWIGTEGEGLIFYEKSTGKIDTYKENSELKSNNITSLFIDAKNNLWISTNTNLFLKKNSSKSFINIEYRDSSKYTTSFYKIIQSKQGNIWAAGLDGIYCFDTATYDYLHINISEEKKYYISHYIIEDKKGNIWFDVNIGKLVCMHPITKEYKIFDASKSMPDVEFKAFLDDDKGNLWASTNRGIYKFINLINQKDTIIFESYKKHNGLQSEQFNTSAAYKTTNGKMYFGSIDGFNSFYPDSIERNTYQPFMIFKNLWLNNNLINVGDTVKGKVILEKNISLTKEIALTHKIKNISIEFAAIHFADPTENRYKYMLEGLDDNWINISAENRKISYNTLPHGDYTLKVKGANLDGVWNDIPLKLKIKVIPQWWKTNVSIFIIIVLFILLMVTIYKLRVKILKKQKKQLKHTVNERTKELIEANVMLEENGEEIRVQNEELVEHRGNLEKLIKKRTSELESAMQKAKESDRLKSAFLANMSHEIRTPLNAIVGFSSLFEQQELTKDDISEYINIINNNSDNLLRIINDILDISSIEVGQLKIAHSVFNVDEIMYELEKIYKLKDNKQVKISYIPQNSTKSLIINNDSLRFRQVITNLLNNAVKFTSKGFIKFGYNVLDSKITFFVEDSGTGISDKNKKDVFTYFKKMNPDSNEIYIGTGIGLSISKNLVELMGGKLWFESENGKGTKFMFTLSSRNQQPVSNR